MILLPGVPSNRPYRRSALIFSWHAKDAVLLPVTGQQPTFTSVPDTTLPPVIPGVGSTVSVGNAMPRFGRLSLSGVPTNYLETSGLTSGQDDEQLSYDFGLLAQDLSVLIRLTGLWTAGATLTSFGYVMSLGNGTAGAGTVRITRNSNVWQAQRQTAAGGTANISLTENAALVWPADVLLTYVQSTGIVTLTLRSANGTLYGPVSTAGLIATGRFAGEVFGLGSDAGLALGQPMRLFFAKIAYGVQTFAAMDALV